MKAWKGTTDSCGALWSGTAGNANISDYECRGGPDRDTPVLVIDASEFPKEYPLPQTECMNATSRVKVISPPWQSSNGNWWVKIAAVQDGYTSDVLISRLKPIPQTATGEVVGTVTVETSTHTVSAELGGWSSTFSACPSGIKAGTYDIIKR